MLLARLAPGILVVAVVVEAVDAGVAVAVGYIQVAAGRGHQLGGIVERAGGSRHQLAGHLGARIGVHHVATQHLDELAVERVHHAGGRVPVGQVHDVVLDVEAVGVHVAAVAPAALECAGGAVEDGDGRVGPVERVDVAGGVAGQGAHRAQGMGRWHFGPIGGEGVGMLSASNGGHGLAS